MSAANIFASVGAGADDWNAIVYTGEGGITILTIVILVVCTYRFYKKCRSGDKSIETPTVPSTETQQVELQQFDREAREIRPNSQIESPTYQRKDDSESESHDVDSGYTTPNVSRTSSIKRIFNRARSKSLPTKTKRHNKNYDGADQHKRADFCE